MANVSSIENKRSKCLVCFIVGIVKNIRLTRFVASVKNRLHQRALQGILLKITMANIGEN